MKNKKLIATAILVPLISMGIGINAFANESLKKNLHSDKDSVIESLLNGKSLTTEQESIKTEMLSEISERKIRDSKHDKIKSIEEKIKNGKSISNDEQTLLNEFKTNKLKGPKLLGGPILNNLSDDEQTKFNNMSESDKKTFLDSKIEEERNYKKSKEKVIYNLVSGVKLTSEEEIIRQNIKNEMEEKMIREAEHEKIKNIEEKVISGETLSDDEKAKLEEFKSNRP